MEEWQQIREILRREILCWEPVRRPEQSLIYQKTETKLTRLARIPESKPRFTVLQGRKGSGRKLLLKNVAWSMKQKLFFLDLSVFYQLCAEAGPVMAAALHRELAGEQALLCITVKDGEEKKEEWERLSSLLAEEGISCYLLVQAPFPEPWSGRCEWIIFPFDTPGMEQKRQLWACFLEDYAVEETVDPGALGNRYTLNAGEIRRVLSTARLAALSDGSESIREKDIVEAVRCHDKGSLGAYARKVPLAYSFEDMVMGAAVRRGLADICSQIRFRNVVGEQWGFFGKKAYGRGISVLFYGPPGTGKTMAAQALARELGMDLYRVDLARMMSKYIGETQKNISALFAEARSVQAVLFFDEADAFFSQRTGVKDSHDRTANGEVAHLLQEMEDYDGISILATNLKDNMDSAFKRRIKIMVPFDMPDKAVRRKMWRQALPETCPREAGLDLDFFADHYELPGSEIQDILLGAAYLAASEGTYLCNRHLIRALKSSFLKYGRALSEEEFQKMGEGRTDGEKTKADTGNGI